ncbi:MAG: alpha/beta fold hydrolase [Gloeomargaritaceae cyanobacterium C42_A2020_066]|nr:alpha/beta fold hydrolase [Gloeomargaritaceae cyanobacterium C42_A2020_066]
MPKTNIGGLEMYYEVHGRGEPLVLIHGLGMACSTWFNQIPLLSQSYQVVVFDNRGAGRTEAPADAYTLDMMATDTAALFQSLDIPQAHVLGFSLGGLIAQRLALQQPDRIRSLLLVSTATQLPPKAKQVMETWLEMSRAGLALDILAREGLLWVYTDAFFRDNQAVNAAVESARHEPHPLTLEGFAGQVAALVEAQTAADLHHIQVPTLVVAGRDDILIPPAYAAELAAQIPGAELVILEPAGHNCWMEFPELFNSTILHFLNQITTR